MPYAIRKCELSRSSSYDSDTLLRLEQLAAKAVGSLSKRGWRFVRVEVSDISDYSLYVIFERSNRRDRGFAATTAAQWTEIQYRLVASAVRCGWTSTELIETPERKSSAAVADPVTKSAAAADISVRHCRDCGCENWSEYSSCFVCGFVFDNFGETATVTPDSELQQLIANVKSAVAALEIHIAKRGV